MRFFMKTTIGLFGTCGQSTWRKIFIEAFSKQNIPYFNPQLPEGTWTPECSDIENQHFKTDSIILFPVTSETTAFGSLGEVGFSIQSLMSDFSKPRYFVFMIDDNCEDPKASEQEKQASIRARKLVKSKLQEQQHANVIIVHSLEKMLEVSLAIYNHCENWNSILNKIA